MENKSMEIIEGLNYMNTYMKKAAFYTSCGKSAVWFSQRFNKGKNRGATYSFTQQDAELITAGLRTVGNQLRHMNVSRDVPRLQTILDVRDICKLVNSRYLREEILHCNLYYWKDRTQTEQKTQNCYLFTHDDVDRINKAIQDIAKICLSIELHA